MGNLSTILMDNGNKSVPYIPIDNNILLLDFTCYFHGIHNTLDGINKNIKI